MISIPHKVSVLTLTENIVIENGQIPNPDIWYKEIRMSKEHSLILLFSVMSASCWLPSSKTGSEVKCLDLYHFILTCVFFSFHR